MKKFLRRVAATPLLCPLLALAPAAVLAGPADYIYSPLVEEGEREIDMKLGSARAANGEPRESVATLGYGIGVNRWWFTEFYVVGKNQSPNGTYYDAVEWENKFQLTERGEYPFELGALLEIEKPKGPKSGWEVKWGPLFQTDLTSKIQLNANLLIKSYIDSDESGLNQMLYQLQAKYRWKRELEFGVQALGDSGGKWTDWGAGRDQSHRVGPAVFGKLPLEGRSYFRYNAAWLIGTSPGAPRNTVRAQLEYAFF